jgi:hypothetical protein
VAVLNSVKSGQSADFVLGHGVSLLQYPVLAAKQVQGQQAVLVLVYCQFDVML